MKRTVTCPHCGSITLPVKYLFGHYRPTAGPARACSIEGCERTHHARGWCKLHHKRWWVHGDPLTVLDPHEEREYERREEADRFWEKVDKLGPVPPYAPDLGPCWIWTATRSDTGYGSFTRTASERNGTAQRANSHRWAYEATKGQVADGLHLDHLCRVRACVNPDHLEPVTPAENSRRGAEARRHEAEGCGDHTRRCDRCGDRICAIDGPEPRICGVTCADCPCSCTGCLQVRQELRAELAWQIERERP